MQADPRSSGSDQEQDDAELPSSSRKQKATSKAEKGVPAHSLSRTLTQALHSSDTGLLESCLRHTNKDLIHNTVQRLPPQLVVPLLMACVERLGRGARGNNMKGGGGGASTQRGLGLIAWVKSALTIHSGYLMTVRLPFDQKIT
jgi:U3 small nucleolar RNA-associated protein 5